MHSTTSDAGDDKTTENLILFAPLSLIVRKTTRREQQLMTMTSIALERAEHLTDTPSCWKRWREISLGRATIHGPDTEISCTKRFGTNPMLTTSQGCFSDLFRKDGGGPLQPDTQIGITTSDPFFGHCA